MVLEKDKWLHSTGRAIGRVVRKDTLKSMGCGGEEQIFSGQLLLTVFKRKKNSFVADCHVKKEFGISGLVLMG